MVNFVADNVGFNDVNLRNLKIEYTKAETVGGSETIKYPFDSLCFVANGTGFASSGGKTWRDLSRGETVYVRKNEEFTFVSTGTDEFEIYSVIVDTYGNDDFFGAIGFSNEKRVCSLDGKMTVVEEIYKTAKKGNSASAYESVGKFFEVISYFAQAFEGEEKPRTMIAEAVYLNRSYFSTMFKSVTGVSPLEYLIDFRIKQACKLLAMGKGVTDTAMLTGFNSASAFAVHFKRKMKETPSEYRAKAISGGKK